MIRRFTFADPPVRKAMDHPVFARLNMSKSKFSVFALLILSLFGLRYLLPPQSGVSHAKNLPEEIHTQSPSNFLLGGIQMNEGDQRNWVRTVRKAGMNTVEVTVYAHQGRWTDNNLWFADYAPGVREEIRLAKAEGLKVVLILRLQLDHAFPDNNFMWHGMVFPETEYLLQRWFEEYTRFAKKWAIVADEEKVDVLVLGSEMNAMFSTRPISDTPNLMAYFLNRKKQQKYIQRVLGHAAAFEKEDLFSHGTNQFASFEHYLQTEVECKEKWAKKVTFADSSDPVFQQNVRRAILNYYWERMINDVRPVYKGKLTIAANFDNYKDVKFWHKLDFIGINAYFPLRKVHENENLPAVFRENWTRILDEILEFRKLPDVPDLPVLFTELGYANHEGATIQPWQGFGFSHMQMPNSDTLIFWKNQPKRPSERNLAVKTLYDVVQEKQFPLGGILYWKLTTKDEQLQYDPFALHIAKSPTDSLQELLTNFLRLGN